MILCSEIIRQVLPYLSAEDSGRWLLFTSKSIMDMVGEEFVWKTICEKHDFELPPPPPSSSDDGGDGNAVAANFINYKEFFQQRRCRKIQLASSSTAVPYSIPPKTTFQDWNIVVDVWCKSNNNNMTISQWLHPPEVQELLEQGKVTITNSRPIQFKQLSKEKARGWNLPIDFSGWKARVQLFKTKRKSNQNSGGGRKIESSSSSDAVTVTNLDEGTSTAHHTHHQHGGDGAVLLDTDFTLWRPWSQSGELTFIQKDRNNGLALSDRGQWLEYKIIRSTTSRANPTVSKPKQQQHSKRTNWEGYLGFQCKLVFLCEPEQQESPSMNNDFVSFEFRRIRLEVIRLHENEHGNIRHYLFRPDNQGWNRHGIHLLHLIEELM